MKISSKIVKLATKEGMDLIDITEQVESTISKLGVTDGFVIVSSRHTTTALYINEYEKRLLDDIKSYFARLVPEQDKYLHNDIHLRDCPEDEPENAHSHIIGMLLSSSETVPVVNGELSIGKWQSIIFAELDGPRERSLNIQVVYS